MTLISIYIYIYYISPYSTISPPIWKTTNVAAAGRCRVGWNKGRLVFQQNNVHRGVLQFHFNNVYWFHFNLTQVSSKTHDPTWGGLWRVLEAEVTINLFWRNTVLPAQTSRLVWSAKTQNNARVGRRQYENLRGHFQKCQVFEARSKLRQHPYRHDDV